MILRKTPSAFLRTLRSIPADKLPTLPQKKLSRAQYRRLENAVFTKIAAEEHQMVFDTVSTAVGQEPLPFYDSPIEITVIGERGAWKKQLRRNLPTVIAAFLCFAVLVTGVYFRGNIASYLYTGVWTTDTSGMPDTSARDTENALYQESDLPETGVEPPYENAEGLRLDVIEIDTTYTGRTSLSVRLTSDDPLEGISVQYSRVILTKWNSETEQYETLYDVYTSPQPKLDILAGVLDFPLVGLGKTNTVEADITVSRDLRGQTGIYYLVLEGLTLVRDSEDPASGDYETALIAETLTDSTVLGSFVIYPESVVEIPNPPPESTYPPHDATEQYSLSVTHTAVHNDNTVTLDMRLESADDFPVGLQIFYQICEIDLWNPEKQVWEGKFGTDDSDLNFAHMLMAGDGGMQFWLGTHFEPTDAATATMSYLLPDNGWYRITLRGLVLVRDTEDNAQIPYELITETLDEGAVYALFYKE